MDTTVAVTDPCLADALDPLLEIGLVAAMRRTRSGSTMPSGSTRELPRSGRCTPEHGRDLLERKLEHVVQYERQTLGWTEMVEDDEQGETNRVSQ